MSMSTRFESISRCALVITFLVAPSGLAAQNPSPWDLAVSFGAFGGQFQFADSTHLPTQEMFGGSVAVDFGRGVLLRGYYWQGVTEDLDATDPMFGYGGEIQFDVNLFSAVKPFFVGGLGSMDFGADYEDELGRTPEKTTTYDLGAGVAIDLARWLRLEVAARNYLFEGPRLEDMEVADTRHSSLLLTGGVTITLGRRKTAPSVRSIIAGETAQVPAGMVLVPGAQAGVAALNDSLRGGLPTPLADGAVRSILTVEIGYLDALFPDQAKLGEERSPISGERADTLKARLTYRMHEAFDYLATAEAAAVLAELDAQLDAYGITLDAKDEILTAARETLAQRVWLVEAEGREQLIQLDSAMAWEDAEARRRRRLSGALGGSFGNGTQFLMGGQLGLAAPWSPNFSFVPEVTLGFFDGGVSALVQGSLRYFYSRDGAEPYGGLGLGVLVLSGTLGDLSGSSVALTPILGVEIPATGMRDVFGEGLKGYFVEYQGVGFFDLHRLVFGLNWGF
jgi:hypothetical protein